MSTSWHEENNGGTLHNGDHARTNAGQNSSINILDWINAPKKFSKGMNFPNHLRSVKRFIEQAGVPKNYHIAILTNSLDEDAQLELFSHPDFHESEKMWTRSFFCLKRYSSNQIRKSPIWLPCWVCDKNHMRMLRVFSHDCESELINWWAQETKISCGKKTTFYVHS